MCGGCQEFYPEFKKFANSFNHIKHGVIYVEDDDSMKLINRFKGVMDKGLPALILIDQQDPYKFKQLMFGNVLKESELRKIVVPLVKDLKMVTGLYQRVPTKKGNDGKQGVKSEEL